MTNEQRAHDLALLVTKYVMSNPHTVTDGSITVDKNGNCNVDIYTVYKKQYQEILEAVNRDF